MNRDFDNFIFGITKKDKAKKLRDSRYDLVHFRSVLICLFRFIRFSNILNINE